MKTREFAIIAFAATGMALSAPLAAQDVSQDEDNILVQPTSAEARYAARVSSQLDRNLSHYRFTSDTHPTGIVRVQFRANGAGVAEDMTLIGESGSRRLDRAAMWAIGRLTEISPDFAEHSDGRLVQANIVFANSEREGARLFRQLGREETARIALAQERGDAPVLALTLGGGARAH